MTILGVDLSHWQGYPDFAQVKASGRTFAVLKATEGPGYVDPSFAVNRATAHAAGLVVGAYHFARAGDPAAEAAYFVRTIGPLQPGEFLVLDQEVPNTVAWCQAWLDAVFAATGVRPMIYMNQSASTGLKLGDWSRVAVNYGLWLAVYDQSTAQPSVPYWGAPAMKQFYDKGVVPGVAGPCDVNVFFGSRDQLLAYGKGGPQPAPPPPPPTVQEDAMRLIRTPDGTIWKVTDTEVVAEGNPNLASALAKTWGPWADVTAADKDIILADANARAARQLGIAQDWILGDRPGEKPYLYDRVVGLGDAVGALQSGGVDPQQVAGLVIEGIKAIFAAQQPPTPAA